MQHVARPLFDNLQEIEGRVSEAARVDLFLDFDGTVSAIVPRPSEAVMTDGIRTILSAIVARSYFTLSFVSGRGLSDLRTRAAIPGAMYVGNHGLEIQAGQTPFTLPDATRSKAELQRVANDLTHQLREFKNAEIENKGLTLSVHFRREPERLHPEISAIARGTVVHSDHLVAREGKSVVEIRPAFEWNKGHAVKWICREVLRGCSFPIYIGDDVTDEDAFAAVEDGLPIRVGQGTETRAHYTLPDIAAVEHFLHWLNRTKAHGEPSAFNRTR